eukprot:Skav213875  [mRNA]  locus=scaffold2374:89155:90118:+ [translate_table: standard]
MACLSPLSNLSKRMAGGRNKGSFNELSKAMTCLLRHAGQKKGLYFTLGGFVRLWDVFPCLRCHRVSDSLSHWRERRTVERLQSVPGCEDFRVQSVEGEVSRISRIWCSRRQGPRGFGFEARLPKFQVWLRTGLWLGFVEAKVLSDLRIVWTRSGSFSIGFKRSFLKDSQVLQGRKLWNRSYGKDWEGLRHV